MYLDKYTAEYSSIYMSSPSRQDLIVVSKPIVDAQDHGPKNFHVSNEVRLAFSTTDAFHSTGATGYIAGDALVTIYNKHPDYEYVCLVRTQDKADKVTKAFPNVRIVLGGLDDSQLLEDEAAKADVVLRMSSTQFERRLTDMQQMQQMLLTTKEPPKPSQRDW